MADADLAEQINRQLRKQVIDRHAQRQGDRVAFCRPTGGHRLGKVIYPTRVAAETAALELLRVGGKPQNAYECKRGTHYHLYTDRTRA